MYVRTCIHTYIHRAYTKEWRGFKVNKKCISHPIQAQQRKLRKFLTHYKEFACLA
jgi:hypothetical protein